MRAIQEFDQALLYIPNKKDLVFLVQNIDLLLDLKVLLILPERSEEMLSQGLKLFPRYIGYPDSDFSEIGNILQNMQRNNGGK